MSSATQICPTCGGAFSTMAMEGQCPVCLLGLGLGDEEKCPTDFLHYAILKQADGSLFELGRGAMGVTYKALDRNLGSFVALKMIQSSYLEDAGVRERFTQEARAAARLQHPNVASVFHLDSEGRNAFYVMEYVAGETLEEYVRRKGRLPGREALEIVRQVTRALAAADRHGLVHRDIKPSNIMLIHDEHGDCMVKVIDFGLAKLRASPTNLTQGHFVGTPQFASPEQFSGSTVDIRSDIYALGMTLWFMLTGSVPLSGDLKTIGERYRAGQALPEEQICTLSAPVKQILGQMLHADPQRRPQSPALLQQAIKKCREALPAEEGRVRRRWFSPGAAFALAAVLVMVGFIFFKNRPAPAPSGPPSLVVLPFKNLSPEPKDAWFSEALTDQVTTNLAQIGDLKVVSPLSAGTFAGSRKSSKEIGRELGVTAVLEGSATRDGTKLRVSTRLIDARTERVLTAATYDREMKDIFEVQADLARRISAALHASLDRQEENRLQRKPTENISAYDMYLRGRDYYHRYDFDDNERAIRLFTKALEIDPNFALAYAGLADAYAQKTNRFSGEERWLAEAMEAAQKAIRLNPDLAEPYKSIGLIHYGKGAYLNSIEASSQAIERNPNMVGAIVNRALALREMGKLDEALAGMLAALQIDPLNVPLRSNLGDLYVALNEPEKATAAFQSAIDLQPEAPDALTSLCRLQFLSGKPEIASQGMALLLRRHPTAPYVLNLAAQIPFLARDFPQARARYTELLATNRKGDVFYLGAIRYLTALGCLDRLDGNLAASEAFLSEAEKLDRQAMADSAEYASPIYDLAAIQALRGEKDSAMSFLKKAIDAGWTDVASLRMDPRFDPLREHPGFKELVAELETKISTMQQKALDSSFKDPTTMEKSHNP